MNTDLKPKKNYLSLALLLLMLFVLLMSVRQSILIPKIPEKSAVVEPHVSEATDPFALISLEAKSAYVYDVKNNLALYAMNEEAQLPLASLTKVMTTLLARELVPKETTITISKDAIKQEGDSGLFENEKWRLSDISDLTLIASSNDGAHAIAGVINAFLNEKSATTDIPADFIDAMNKKATSLGMAQTFFLNESGLDTTQSLGGAYGSAKDMALLVLYSIKKYPDLFEATQYRKRSFESLSDFKHIEKNTNELVGALPELLASKTGFTDLAGGNLVIAFEAGPMRPIIVSVLGSTVDGRFDDVEKLAWASIEKIAQ
ncbi:MAG: D-alanyl-D-alanine carboxypeptidase [Parcubacteria group bacterium]|nr:D-alanyl-D-alanine carboxypeptidase [Parcubacteria group bacterium]